MDEGVETTDLSEGRPSSSVSSFGRLENPSGCSMRDAYDARWQTGRQDMDERRAVSGPTPQRIRPRSTGKHRVPCES